MILTVDVGNSNIVVGLWNEKGLQHRWRIHTVIKKTEDEYGTIFKSLLIDEKVEITHITAACLSSVVPPLTGPFTVMLERLVGKRPIVLGPEVYEKLPITVLNPYEIGSDLVADALAAYELAGGAALVVDFGTALTFTAIDGKGVIQGVAIAPGLNTAVLALSRNTAQLPPVDLTIPPAPYGKNTVHAIQAGIVYGYTGLVEYMVDKITHSLGEPLQVIGTGGLCRVISPLTTVFTSINPDLTLYGLKRVAEIVASTSP